MSSSYVVHPFEACLLTEIVLVVSITGIHFGNNFLVIAPYVFLFFAAKKL
jgi:hypothetical protein